MAGRIRSGDLDLAFVGLFVDQLPPDLAHQVLTVEPPVVVLPPGHWLASSADPIDLRELATEESVEMRPESGLRRQVTPPRSGSGCVGRSPSS